jgi:cold shock CspA family protein
MSFSDDNDRTFIQGTCIQYANGFGFIRTELGVNYFVHRTDICLEDKYEQRLEVGDKVEFFLGTNQDGRLAAKGVMILEYANTSQ